MKCVGYGRVHDGASEVPLKTQEHTCRHFCEQENHSFEKWFTDECKGDEPFIDRDGATDLLRWLSFNEDITGVLTYDWERISTDPVGVAVLDPVFHMGFQRDIHLLTPDGEIDLTQHPDPQNALVGRLMNETVEIMDTWKAKLSSIRIRKSLNALIDSDEFSPIAAPYGLESDKQRYENRQRVRQYLPDDQGDVDKFKRAVQILNEYAYNDTSPEDLNIEPTPVMLEKKYGVSTQKQKTMWKYQETYREVADKHREDVTVVF